MASALSTSARNRRLKIAFGELVHAVGDDSDAANITRVGRSTIARYRSLAPADADFFAPVDVVYDLERVAGVPLVTKLLCELGGGTFEGLPEAKPASDALTGLHNLSTEFNDVTGAICEGLKDGNLCDTDREAIVRELDQLLQRVTELRAWARKTNGERA